MVALRSVVRIGERTMNRLLPLSAKVLGGFFVAALWAFPQGYTISAKPGAVNYFEGNAQLDGQALTSASLRAVFMNAGSLLETRDGKVEVLLTPGVFLRVGENSRVRMLKPSLIDTQIAIEAGESMLEVDEYVKESRLTVSERGGLTTIEKTGLYRFMADGEASVAVIDGKAEVSFGEKHTSLGKGHEALLTDALKTRAFDKDQADELYAWSNIRAQYNASLTYQAAKTAYSSGTGYGSGGYGGGGYGYGNGLYNGGYYGGFNSFYGNGWLWSSGFNSWLWMPGGEFFSPFGWGFYGPGYAYYAPVVTVPVVAGGGPVKRPPLPTVGGNAMMSIPVNPKHLPAIGVYSPSPARFEAARMQTAHMISAGGGLRTGSGAHYSSGGSSSSGGTSSGGGGHSFSGGMPSSSSMSSSGSAPSGSMSGHSAAGGGGHK
jgi:hypothetical protein